MACLAAKPFCFTANIEKQKLFLPRKTRVLLGSLGKSAAIAAKDIGYCWLAAGKAE